MSDLTAYGVMQDAYDDGIGLFWNIFSAIRANKMREEQYEREDTAVQRRMRDLRAAGVNPLLAGGQAAAASPVSAQSFMQSAPNQNYAQMALVKSQIEKNKADARASNAAERKQLAEAGLSEQMKGKVRAEEELLKGQASMIEIEKDHRWRQGKLIDAETLLQQSRIATDAASRQKIYKEIGKINEEWNNLTLEFQRKGVELDRMYRVDEFIRKYPKLGTLYLMLGPTGSGMALHGAMKSGSEIVQSILDLVPVPKLPKSRPKWLE